MAVTVVGAGSWGSGNSGGNPVCTAPTVSGGILATDMLVVVVNVHKAAAQTETLPTTHSTRAAMALLASAEGNTQSTATDTGPCLIGVYTETGASIAGDDGATITTNIDGFTSGTSGTSAATRCLVLRRDDTGKPWSAVAATGADNTTGAAWSVTFGSNPGISAGDLLLVGNALPTDTALTYGSDTVAATGATLGAQANDGSLNIAAGVDAGGRNFVVPCSAGTATAAPTWTATLSGTSTNAAGPAIIARFRAQSTTVAGDQAAETDTAQAGAGLRTVPGEVAAEAGTATAGTGSKATAGGVAGEASIGTGGTGGKTATGSHSAEADTAPEGAGRVLGAASTASETDTAWPGVGQHLAIGGQAGEAGTAYAGSGYKTATGGIPAGEVGAALAGAGVKTIVAGRALEEGFAASGVGLTSPVGTVAAEQDTASAGSGRKTAAAGWVGQTDVASAGSGLRSSVGLPAREADLAVSGAVLTLVIVAGIPAGEIDSARVGAGRKTATGGPAGETDQAVAAALRMVLAASYALDGTTTASSTAGTTTEGVRVL